MGSTVEKLPLARVLKACCEVQRRPRNERRDDQDLIRPRLWICGQVLTPRTTAAPVK